MLKIGDFAKLCNVSARTLRYYDDEGVLKADFIDEATGYRFYLPEAKEKYQKIIFYKELGFSLEEIKKLLAANEEEEKEMLKKKKGTLLSSVQQIQGQVQTINTMFGENGGRKTLSDILKSPFTNDPEVIGKWEFCGVLRDEKDFCSAVEQTDFFILKKIIFMPGGAPVWMYFWTKGILYRISNKYNFAIPNTYKTVRKNGDHYMVIQYMTDDCIENGANPIPMLYRQVDTIAYSKDQARPYIDKIDYPFVEDPQVSGMWNVVDFVCHAEDFDPAHPTSPKSKLATTNLQFLPRGLCVKYARSRKSGNIVNWGLSYTKGFIIDREAITAEEYIIKKFDGKDYLLVQHKSGDYIYGGMEPYWYVFERKGEEK